MQVQTNLKLSTELDQNDILAGGVFEVPVFQVCKLGKVDFDEVGLDVR